MNHLGKKRSRKFRELDRDQLNRFGAYRSQACGKTQHNSKSAAKSALRAILGDGDTVEKDLLTVYQCERCAMWHVGRIRHRKRAE